MAEQGASARGERTRQFLQSRLNIKRDSIQPVTAAEFLRIWTKYDQNANRYLEREELSSFLRDFITNEAVRIGLPVAGKGGGGASTPSAPGHKGGISDADMREFCRIFMEEYDEDGDGRISIRELTHILPVEECIRVIFNQEADVARGFDYVKIWRKYDVDGSGFLERDELKQFLQDLLERKNPQRHIDPAKLNELTNTIMTLYDVNDDGRLGLSEMVRLLPQRENFVHLTLGKARQLQRLSQSDINKILERYDQDGNGTLEESELENLLVDLLDATQTSAPGYNAHDLKELKEAVLRGCDLDGDGRIDRKELAIVLLAVVQSGLSAFYSPITETFRAMVLSPKNSSASTRKK